MSRAEVAQQVADVRVTPGLWEIRTAVSDVVAPELPRELAARLRSPRPPIRHCITPEQAQPASFPALLARSGDCAVQDFSMTGGRMRGRMLCRAGTARQVAAEMSGSYAPNAFNYRHRIETPAPGVGGAITLTVQTAGRRVGDCPAGGEQAP